VRFGSVIAAGAALAALTVSPGAMAATPAVTASASPQAASQPNVVIVLTDDQRYGTEVGMPTVMDEVVAKGITYPNAFVPTSWCCPSRASLLTGNFSHTTGVWENTASVPYGAWQAFKRLGGEQDTIATRLQDAGYRTGIFGKYLNGIDKAPSGFVAPGWDVFDALTRPGPWKYGFMGESKKVTSSRQYLTDEIADRTVEFIESTPADQPLFAFVTPYAPHLPFVAGPYAGAAKKAGVMPAVRAASGLPSPAVNQRDMSEYPDWMQSLTRSRVFTKGRPHELSTVIRLQQDMLMGIDAAVADILDALDRTERLRDTIIVFASDNGYLLGEHRLQRKNTPYDASVRVPLALRYDRAIAAGVVDERIAIANVDVYSTVLDLAGVVGAQVDGRSLLSRQPRDGLVMEAAPWRGQGRPAYCGWREEDFAFWRYTTGEEEAYDYVADPHELINVADDPQYADRVAAARDRARIECDPLPPLFTWEP
jgi:N-acetylglucosamine-6-sulfatase